MLLDVSHATASHRYLKSLLCDLAGLLRRVAARDRDLGRGAEALARGPSDAPCAPSAGQYGSCAKRPVQLQRSDDAASVHPHLLLAIRWLSGAQASRVVSRQSDPHDEQKEKCD